MLAVVVIGLYVVLVLSAAYFALFRGHRSREFEAAERRERALLAMKLWREPDND